MQGALDAACAGDGGAQCSRRSRPARRGTTRNHVGATRLRAAVFRRGVPPVAATGSNLAQSHRWYRRSTDLFHRFHGARGGSVGAITLQLLSWPSRVFFQPTGAVMQREKRESGDRRVIQLSGIVERENRPARPLCAFAERSSRSVPRCTRATRMPSTIN